MCHDSAVDSKGSAGAPEHEIEITPEMIRAGVRELALFSPESSQLEDTCVDIFAAMIAASRKSKSKVVLPLLEPYARAPASVNLEKEPEHARRGQKFMQSVRHLSGL